MHRDPEIVFRPAQAADPAMLDVWLRQPRMRDWRDEPEVDLGHIRAMIEGRSGDRLIMQYDPNAEIDETDI